jgi:hypothetical protein
MNPAAGTATEAGTSTHAGPAGAETPEEDDLLL